MSRKVEAIPEQTDRVALAVPNADRVAEDFSAIFATEIVGDAKDDVAVARRVTLQWGHDQVALFAPPGGSAKHIKHHDKLLRKGELARYIRAKRTRRYTNSAFEINFKTVRLIKTIKTYSAVNMRTVVCQQQDSGVHQK